MHSVPSHSASKPHDSDYSRNRARSIRFLILLAAILALAFFLSLRAGSYNTPAAELIRGIFGRASDAKINLVIRNNRLPRICTAMVAGAGLGLAGCILQAVLRNPLASASTLGVSQGATFGAAVAIIGLGLSQAGSWAIPLCSFLGSLLVAAVILGLSQFKQISSAPCWPARPRCCNTLPTGSRSRRSYSGRSATSAARTGSPCAAWRWPYCC